MGDVWATDSAPYSCMSNAIMILHWYNSDQTASLGVRVCQMQYMDDAQRLVLIIFDEEDSSQFLSSLGSAACITLVGGLDHLDYFSRNIGEFHDPNWLSYFSEGLKPPTSTVVCQNVYIILTCLNKMNHDLTVNLRKYIITFRALSSIYTLR